MTSIDLLGAETGADKWQRLAPAAIIHFIVKFVIQVIKQGVQGLVYVGAVALTAGDNRWFIIGLIGLAIVIILLAGSVLSYLKFRFRVTGDTFLIQKGVFTRKRLSLSFDRIQNVAFKQPIYFRPFNMVLLSIESAGSSGEEVSLAGIPRSLAEEIRTTIFAKKSEIPQKSEQGTETDTQSPDVAGRDEEEIIRLPIAELVRYGLSNNNIWVFAGVIAGALAQFDWYEYAIFDGARHTVEEFAQQSLLFTLSTGLAVFAVIVLLLLAVSSVGAIITHYDYHLTRGEGRFHRTKGFFEKQETSLPERKIQSLVFKQAWPARLLNRFHVYLKQVGFAKASGDGMPNTGNNFLIPSTTREFVDKFSKDIFPDFGWSYAGLKPIHPAFTRRIVLWIILPIAAIPAITLSLIFTPYFLLILLVPLLLAPIIWRIRVQYGYATDGKHGIIQSGFIGHKLTLFAFHKVQTVELFQSPGQRQQGLATLVIKLAGFTTMIPYMYLEEAQAWRDKILYQVETNKEKWM